MNTLSSVVSGGATSSSPFLDEFLTVATSILCTGDAYLSDAASLNRLARYFSEERISRVGVFQVMHHGAEKNWHTGVAKRIAPHFSIFSSDPERKKWLHPHPPVVRDFLPYGPIQIDKTHQATICSDFCDFCPSRWFEIQLHRLRLLGRNT